MIPRPGDTFVEMEASPGEWDDNVETIEEVMKPLGNGRWLVQWDDKFELRQTVIIFSSGRWRRDPC